MKTYSEYKQELAEQQQLDEWIVPVGQVVARILVATGIGGGLFQLGTGVGKGVESGGEGVGTGVSNIGTGLGENATKIAAILAAAGLGAVVIRQVMKYLADERVDRMRTQRQIEDAVEDALKAAGVSPNTKVSERKVERIIEN